MCACIRGHHHMLSRPLFEFLIQEEIRKKTGYVIQRADGVFDVDANTSIEDLREALEVKLPEVSYQLKQSESC